MKLFAVYGDEWLTSVRVLLGVYDTELRATRRMNEVKRKHKHSGIMYNEYTVREIELNKDIEDE